MIKEFTKSLSIYGILPILGKFLGFFFIPIYVRIFDKSDYAAIELLLNSANFLTFLISLEMYTAVGRMFNEKSDEEKGVLVSTGFWLTVLSSVIVVTLGLVFKRQIIFLLFNEFKYLNEYYFVLIAIVLNAYFSYFSVITRYKKREKKFVLINLASLIVRFVSTLLFVLVLKTGIVGVIFGQILGYIVNFIFFYQDNKEYVIFKIDKVIIKQILNFSVPMVPGLLIFGAIEPIIRISTLDILNASDLADYSFAFRLASVFTIVSFAVQMAYKPFIFEKIKSNTYKESIIKISAFYESLIFLGGCLLILFGREIIRIMGTPQYYDSVGILGLIIYSQLLSVLTNFRSLGPEISKKTKYLFFISGSSFLLLIAGLQIFTIQFGLIGVGMAIILYQMFRYISQTFLSLKLLNIKYSLKNEILFNLLIISVIIISALDMSLIFRIILSVALILFLVPKDLKIITKKYISEAVS
jgi:O-antigen/teichoic acid export membrane protein